MNDTSGTADNQNTRLWSERAAFWVGSAETNIDVADTYNQPFLEAVELRAGHRLLDIAAGPGEPTLSAASIVGPKGLVVASDLAPGMLDGLRARGIAMDRTNFRLAAADMQMLPFADRSFDRVTCRMGIMFAPDTDATLAGIQRVLVQGGRTAFMFWGPDGDTTMFNVLRETTAEVLNAGETWTDSVVYRFGVPGTLTGKLQAAGFVNVQESGAPIVREAPVGPAFWANQLRMGYGALIEAADEATCDRLDAKIRERLEPYRSGEVYRLSVHVRTAVGETAA